VTECPASARQPESSASAAFPPAARLRKPAEFKRVFASPFVSADRCFKVLARSNDRGRPRLGMAVSRKVDRKALGRNRIKRVVRESFRLYFLDRRPPLDFVVLPRPASATICNRRLTHSLNVHWQRLAGRAFHAENGSLGQGPGHGFAGDGAVPGGS
jgi:ribonuclease P protein component